MEKVQMKGLQALKSRLERNDRIQKYNKEVLKKRQTINHFSVCDEIYQDTEKRVEEQIKMVLSQQFLFKKKINILQAETLRIKEVDPFASYTLSNQEVIQRKAWNMIVNMEDFKKIKKKKQSLKDSTSLSAYKSN